LFALGEIAAPSKEEIELAAVPLRKYYEQFGIAVPSIESVQGQIDGAAQLNVLIEEKIPVFSFTLGIPSAATIEKLKNAGIKIIGSATNVDEARALVDTARVDAITAQGAEAGGHRGTFMGSYKNSMIGLFALIPQIVDAVDIPVIAAGGIMDGRGIVAALALGAAGVQMGTAFLTVNECPVHANYKQVIQSHAAHDTAITKVFSGGAARGIMNKYMMENENTALLPFPFHNSLTRPIRKVANESGLTDYTNLWSGQSGRLARTVATIDLVNSLAAETENVISELQGSRRNPTP
jgi:nitronate monooxygenase